MNQLMSDGLDIGRLLGSGTIMHSYPYCWRCKKPVIFCATDQWFIAVSKFRDRALDVIDKDVRWIPEWGRDRIHNMVSDRSDWCISRQRVNVSICSCIMIVYAKSALLCIFFHPRTYKFLFRVSRQVF